MTDSRGQVTGRVGGSREGGTPGRRPRSRGRRLARIAGITAGSLILVTAGAGAWLYNHLSGNLHTASLYNGTSGSAGTEKADAFGRTPINILVIGTDSRESAADCRLGGACDGAAGNGNADVEMLLHISADRSNATVMSIPRDTMTQIPACSGGGSSTGGYYGMINSALAYGPGCQVATVHALTGIPIDHFMMVDFAGVVQMSNAVGGVQVCVDNNVYDTYSHLKLAKGSHTLQGVAALEWLRSRHGFGDGGDLGRTYAQHMFLSSLMRSVKSAGTLTDPAALYSLADAATKALTVDSGLGSIGKLLGLADDINKVSTKRTTFTTMQTEQDPANRDRLVVGPNAKSLFAAIINDQSLTPGSSSSPSPSLSPSSPAADSTAAAATTQAPSVPASRIAVHVENGSGLAGRAATVADALINAGFSPSTWYGNASQPQSASTVYYGSGEEAEAQTVAKAVGLPGSRVQSSPYAGVRLVIGSDWPNGSGYGGSSGGSGSAGSDGVSASAQPSPADTQQALSGATAENADTTGTCAQVGTQDTVQYNGVDMTPIQAYAAAAGKVPDSAP
jgi:LCP family protein required for cell wall assembly